MTQLPSPCFNHAGPNFVKQSPNVPVWDRSSRELTLFLFYIGHDDVSNNRFALLLREHPIVLRCSSRSSSQIWFWPVFAVYWKDCPSRWGHGGRDWTSSETLSQALWLLGGLLKLSCNPPNFLRKHSSHAGVDNMSTQWSQYLITMCTIFWFCLGFEARSKQTLCCCLQQQI